MIGIKSMTSGRLLPCARIKQSRLRLLCGMPEGLVEVEVTGLMFPASTQKWVREADIIEYLTTKDSLGALRSGADHQSNLDNWNGKNHVG